MLTFKLCAQCGIETVVLPGCDGRPTCGKCGADLSVAAPCAAGPDLRLIEAEYNRAASADALEDCRAELAKARARIAELEAPDPAACAELLGIDPARGVVTVRHWAVPLMARSFAEFLLDDPDAKNYRSVVADVVAGAPDDPQRLRLEVVVRRAEAKTPSEVAAERGAELDRLRGRIADLERHRATLQEELRDALDERGALRDLVWQALFHAVNLEWVQEAVRLLRRTGQGPGGEK
jgi:hypothetical protein